MSSAAMSQTIDCSSSVEEVIKALLPIKRREVAARTISENEPVDEKLPSGLEHVGWVPLSSLLA